LVGVSTTPPLPSAVSLHFVNRRVGNEKVALTSQLEQAPGKLLRTATINCVFPALIFLPNGIALSTFVLEKTSLMGAQGGRYNAVVADAVGGGVVGMLVISALGFLTPWIVHACGKGLRVSLKPFWDSTVCRQCQ